MSVIICFMIFCSGVFIGLLSPRQITLQIGKKKPPAKRGRKPRPKVAAPNQQLDAFQSKGSGAPTPI